MHAIDVYCMSDNKGDEASDQLLRPINSTYVINDFGKKMLRGSRKV